ncbi:MAG: transposase [Bdellovibrionales bacterium]
MPLQLTPIKLLRRSVRSEDRSEHPGCRLGSREHPRRNTKKWWITEQNTYGGALNYRKIPRPFAKDKLVHGVFKARVDGALRFTKHDKTIRPVIHKVAVRYGIKIKDLAIHHNHIHLLWYSRSREAHTRFLRLLAAEIGRAYARLRRRFRLKAETLWMARPFTRLVSWGRRSLKAVSAYIQKNRFEVMGFIPYTPRRHALAKFLTSWEKQMRASTA